MYIKQITKKDLLYSTGKSAQYSVMTYKGIESKKKSAYIYIYIYIYNWLTLLYSRNGHNIVTSTILQLKKKSFKKSGQRMIFHERKAGYWCEDIKVTSSKIGVCVTSWVVKVTALRSILNRWKFRLGLDRRAEKEALGQAGLQCLARCTVSSTQHLHVLMLPLHSVFCDSSSSHQRVQL